MGGTWKTGSACGLRRSQSVFLESFSISKKLTYLQIIETWHPFAIFQIMCHVFRNFIPENWVAPIWVTRKVEEIQKLKKTGQFEGSLLGWLPAMVNPRRL